MKFYDRKHLAIIFSIGLVYALLRFWKLTDSCLWFDEIFSLHAAEQDWGGLFWFIAQDLIHPPLFYVFLKFWISIGGESLFWVRSFPLFFSILALVPFYFLCRQLKLNDQAVAISLIFLAANGALIKYSQEVRMYSLLFCLSLFSMWLFARFFRLGKGLIALTIVNLLLVYTHYFGWFVVLSEVVLISVFQNIKIRQILLMVGITLLGFAPWTFAVWQAAKINADVAQNIGWMRRPDAAIIFQFVFDVIEPFYYQQSGTEPTSKFFITVPLLLLIAAAKIFYFADWKNKTEKDQFFLLTIFILVPVALAFAASWTLPVSIWGSRHLIIVFAPMLILSAKFLTEIKPRLLKIAFLSLIFSLFLVAFVIQVRTGEPRFIWCGWENLAQNIDPGRRQKIYVFEDLVGYHFWFALRGRGGGENVQVIKVKNVKGVREDRAYFLPRGFGAVKTIDESEIEGERFFIAFRAENWDETTPPLQTLFEKGYATEGPPKVFEAQGLKAFLVEVKKEKR